MPLAVLLRPSTAVAADRTDAERLLLFDARAVCDDVCDIERLRECEEPVEWSSGDTDDAREEEEGVWEGTALRFLVDILVGATSPAGIPSWSDVPGCWEVFSWEISFGVVEAEADLGALSTEGFSVVSEATLPVLVEGSGLLAGFGFDLLRGGSSTVSSSSGTGLFEGSRKAPGFCFRFLRFKTLGAAEDF